MTENVNSTKGTSCQTHHCQICRDDVELMLSLYKALRLIRSDDSVHRN